MEILDQYYSLVEAGLQMAGIDAALCRSDIPGQWNLVSEDVELWADILHIEEEGHIYFQVMTPVASVPSKNTADFFHELLELNYLMIGASFATYKNGCYIKVTHDARLITPELVAPTMERVAYYGKMFGNRLREKYETTKLEHTE